MACKMNIFQFLNFIFNFANAVGCIYKNVIQKKTDHKTVLRLPINGLSEVMGIISDTVFRNMVNDRRIVTPENALLLL